MDYTPVTPFRRPVDAALLQRHAAARADLPETGTDKWKLLRELATARGAFGLSDRDLTVLQALLSFHPATILGGDDSPLVVHPSNRSICDRLNGMPCSTMRRHLAKLVSAGIVLRRDSPNGKRYARRYGAEKVAYGFDLAPLLHRASEITSAADAVRVTAERQRRLRATVSLMRRDLIGLAEYGRAHLPGHPIWDEASDLALLTARALRRKLSVDDLDAMEARLRPALDAARTLLDGLDTADPSTTACEIEQHHQNSEEDSFGSQEVLDETLEAGEDTTSVDVSLAATRQRSAERRPDGEPGPPNIPLGLILSACQDFQSYSDRPVRQWHDLVRVAHILSPMLGISPSAWEAAKHHMGTESASVVIVAMLERFADIRSPGGYLRALTEKAAAGEFSCTPMVMALTRRAAA